MSLTTAGLKGFTPPADVETIWDTAPDPRTERPPLPGLGLRTRGRPEPASWVWTFKYRHGVTRQQIKATLGRYLTLSPEAARKEAERYENARKVDGADLWEKHATGRAAKKAEGEALKAAAEADSARPTVAFLWDRYWAAEGKHKKAADGYQHLWTGHLEPFFGSRKVADLTPEMVEDFKASRHETPGACNRALALLSVMLSRTVTYGWRKGCAPEHPAKGVKRYPENRVDFHFTAEELGAVLDAAATYHGRTRAEPKKHGRRTLETAGRSEMPGLAIIMLALTGARAGEVLGAHWGQLSELPDGRLMWTVESAATKGGKPITRALSADLSARLTEWRPKSLAISARPKVLEMGASRWLFPQAARPWLHVDRLEKAWAEILDEARLKGERRGRIHDLRHSVGTHMRRRGATMAEIQQQLGHASPLTTARYAHHMPEGVIENGDLVGDIGRDAIAAARARKSAEVIPMRTAQGEAAEA